MHICVVLGGLALRTCARPTRSAAAGASLAIAVTGGATVSTGTALFGRTTGGTVVSASATLFGRTTGGTIVTAVAALLGGAAAYYGTVFFTGLAVRIALAAGVAVGTGFGAGLSAGAAGQCGGECGEEALQVTAEQGLEGGAQDGDDLLRQVQQLVQAAASGIDIAQGVCLLVALAFAPGLVIALAVVVGAALLGGPTGGTIVPLVAALFRRAAAYYRTIFFTGLAVRTGAALFCGAAGGTTITVGASPTAGTAVSSATGLVGDTAAGLRVTATIIGVDGHPAAVSLLCVCGDQC